MIEQLAFLVVQDLFINESGAYADVFYLLPGRRKKARSPTPTAAFSACVKPWNRAARRDPIGRSSVTCRRIENRLGRPQTAFGRTDARRSA